jgi:type IV pilus assembly protein PilC
MFGPGRITTSELAQLCRRLSTALEAGVDVRTVFAREVQRARGLRARARVQAVSQAIQRGESVAEALGEAEGFFPSLFCEMAEVGDQTGHLGETFRHLAEHYEGLLQMRRSFLAAITWPLIQLAVCLAVIGFFIWIMGVIGQTPAGQIDPLGWGLVGERGLFVYGMFLLAAAAAFVAVFRAIQRGVVWTRPIQRFILRLPVLGEALQTLALARMAWSLNLTLNAGMEVRRALGLSLRATRNARYTDHLRPVQEAIAAGSSIHDALVDAGCFPPEFLDAVQVGEESGNLVESMGLLSRQYHQRAEIALKTLTTVAGFAVWALIATVIILFIFRLAFFYIGTIQDAASGKF